MLAAQLGFGAHSQVLVADLHASQNPALCVYVAWKNVGVVARLVMKPLAVVLPWLKMLWRSDWRFLVYSCASGEYSHLRLS